MHKQRLAFVQSSQHEHVRPHRRCNFWQAGSMDQFDTVWHRKHEPLIGRNKLSVSAAGEQRAHAITNCKPGDLCSDLLDDS
jgi:hypothetical protein